LIRTPRLVLAALGGSRAYGVHSRSSDVDLKGVVLPGIEDLAGIRSPLEQIEDVRRFPEAVAGLGAEEARAAQEQGLEGVYYALAKFLRLAADNNPNILDVLFCRDDHVLFATRVGEEMRGERGLFLSTKARNTYAGYAMAQLKRIRTHRNWLLNPPSRAPSRADFGLSDPPEIPAGQRAAVDAEIRKRLEAVTAEIDHLPGDLRERITHRLEEHFLGISRWVGLPEGEDIRWFVAGRELGLSDNLAALMQRERNYAAAKVHFDQYQHWLKARNPERAALEARSGYDTKHAAHLMRLLRMGWEILETGRVQVWRGEGGAGDADELLAIRDGAWSYDTLIERADADMERIARAAHHPHPSLAAAVDLDRVDALAVRWTLNPG